MTMNWSVTIRLAETGLAETGLAKTGLAKTGLAKTGMCRVRAMIGCNSI
jgi:hypothetical protein